MQIEQKKRPIIWSIAGSDCSGGAGIQADIKTAHSLGCEICTLTTANTVQNSNQLIHIHPIDVATLQQQLECLLEDKPPQVIKIGLIANNAQMLWLIESLTLLRQKRAGLLVVFDPVSRASVGANLISEPISADRLNALLKLVDIITPNTLEAKRLAEVTAPGLSVKDWVARTLNRGCKAVLISGGHAVINGSERDSSDDNQHNNHVTDQCFYNANSDCGVMRLRSPRIQTSFGHGSGCTLSTALASFLAHDYLLRDAFIQSKAFMNSAFQHSALQHALFNRNRRNADNRNSIDNTDNTDYYGALIQPNWPVEKCCYPQVVDQGGSEMQSGLRFPSLFSASSPQQLGLYPVVDSIEWLKTLLPLNLNIIQLRIKNCPEAELSIQIQQAIALTKNYPNTRLFINDYWQLAIEHGAYGVHLGQEDIQNADLKAIHHAGLRLGISTHGSYEFKLAQQTQPSYLAIGAVFETQTKDMSGQIQGVDTLQYLVNLNDSTPLVAIGGITLENAPSVISTGVNSIAVVTAITLAKNPKKVVKAFQQLLAH